GIAAEVISALLAAVGCRVAFRGFASEAVGAAAVVRLPRPLVSVGAAVPGVADSFDVAPPRAIASADPAVLVPPVEGLADALRIPLAAPVGAAEGAVEPTVRPPGVIVGSPVALGCGRRVASAGVPTLNVARVLRAGVVRTGSSAFEPPDPLDRAGSAKVNCSGIGPVGRARRLGVPADSDGVGAGGAANGARAGGFGAGAG
ncbi:MAG TPA: hypothetical protein VGF84_16910, partial [Micromonosporaceae bacterium]